LGAVGFSSIPFCSGSGSASSKTLTSIVLGAKCFSGFDTSRVRPRFFFPFPRPVNSSDLLLPIARFSLGLYSGSGAFWFTWLGIECCTGASIVGVGCT